MASLRKVVVALALAGSRVLVDFCRWEYMKLKLCGELLHLIILQPMQRQQPLHLRTTPFLTSAYEFSRIDTTRCQIVSDGPRWFQHFLAVLRILREVLRDPLLTLASWHVNHSELVVKRVNLSTMQSDTQQCDVIGRDSL